MAENALAQLDFSIAPPTQNTGQRILEQIGRENHFNEWERLYSSLIGRNN